MSLKISWRSPLTQALDRWMKLDRMGDPKLYAEIKDFMKKVGNKQYISKYFYIMDKLCYISTSALILY